jgi:hypothetical protein
MENPFLRITIVPALGGRILRLFDKRAQREVLPDDGNSLIPTVGGRRGAFLPHGIQLWLDGEERLNSLGPVAFQVEEPEDEESPAGLWLSESSTANGLGYHLHISVPPDRAEVVVEARIHNRTLRPLPYNGGLAVQVNGVGWYGVLGAYDVERDTGMALFPDVPFDGHGDWEGLLIRKHFMQVRDLAPRQVATWAVRLIPVSGLGRLTVCSPEVAVGITDEAIKIQTVSRRHAHKLVLRTDRSETLEAPLDLYPEAIVELSLSGLPGKLCGVAILDAVKNEVLRADFVVSGSIMHASRSQFNNWPGLDWGADFLKRDTFDVTTRYLAHTLLGIRAMRDGEYIRADTDFERALLYNADDPLLWWEKALAKRLADSESPAEEQTELLNAHFLAPLEPALKAEAFLSQTEPGPQAKNPLVAALAETPEDFVEVAAMLIAHGRLDQAARWIGQALEHVDLAMLHLLLAYCLLAGTRMDAEAADRVAKAARVAGPPYPWREVERTALEALHARFPGDRHMESLLALCPAPEPSRSTDRYHAKETS